MTNFTISSQGAQRAQKPFQFRERSNFVTADPKCGASKSCETSGEQYVEESSDRYQTSWSPEPFIPRARMIQAARTTALSSSQQSAPLGRARSTGPLNARDTSGPSSSAGESSPSQRFWKGFGIGSGVAALGCLALGATGPVGLIVALCSGLACGVDQRDGGISQKKLDQLELQAHHFGH